jgi:CBS domain-containing protein
MTAYSLARMVRPLPIYEALLAQDGVHLPHSGQPTPHVLELLRVGDALRGVAVSLPDTLTAEAALRRTEETAATTFPVLDQTAHLVGCVTTARLRRTIAEGHGEHLLADIADERPLLTADQPVLAALALMDQTDTSELPVVDQRAAPRLIGMLTMGDIVHAQATALDQSGLAQSLDGRPMSEVADILRLPRFTPLPSLAASSADASAPAADETLHYHLVTVPAESGLVGESLEHLHLPAGVLIVMIERGPQALIPHGRTRLAAGDRITLVAARRHIHQLHTLFNPTAPATPSTG